MYLGKLSTKTALGARAFFAGLCLWAMTSSAYAHDTRGDLLPKSERVAMGRLTASEFRAHMAFLADDLLEGRGTGTRGHEIAARYVGAQFEALRLTPLGDKGSFYQRVPLREVQVDPHLCSLTLKSGDRVNSLRWGTDFIVGPSVNSPNASVEAPVVFAGYGVTVPDGRYDDYQGVDVKGKVVALLPGSPPYLSSAIAAHVQRLKRQYAAAHGAIGILYLSSSRSESILPWSRTAANATMPAMDWVGPSGEYSTSVRGLKVRASLSPTASEQLFTNAPKSWAQVLRDAGTNHPQSFSLPTTVSVNVAGQVRDASSPNVIAVIIGSDPKLRHEYVVYSAHADHLGIGVPINGHAIYNGAADDASGVAALITIADAFKALPQPPRRSIIFLATTGEEKGHLGSDYFATYPTVPRDSIVADLNMDGASIFYAFKNIVAIGAEHSSLEGLVRRAASELGLEVTPDPEPEQGLFTRSDQYSFVLKGIPSVFISEGDKAADPQFDTQAFWKQWRANRYHSPLDTMDQPFNFEAARQFMRLHLVLGYEIAQAPARPQWKPGDFFGETFGQHQR